MKTLLVIFLAIMMIPIFAQGENIEEPNDQLFEKLLLSSLEKIDELLNIQVVAGLAGLSLVAASFLISSLTKIQQPGIDLLKNRFNGSVKEFEEFFAKMNKGPKFFLFAFVLFIINLVLLITVLDTFVDEWNRNWIQEALTEPVDETSIYNLLNIQLGITFAEGIPFAIGLTFLLKGARMILQFYTKIN